MTAPQTSPRVYFVEDICRELRLSRRTLERLLRHGAFPIPELPSLDRRHRWSAAAVDAFLHEQKIARRTFGRPTKSVGASQ